MSSLPFLGGLNTELNGITDSTDFTSDELNMMIREDNTRSRRPGIDYEEKYEFSNEVIDPNESQELAFNCVEWTDINSPDETQTYQQTPYIVVQTGGTLLFFRNKGIPYSGDEAIFTLDLAQYRINDASTTATKTSGGEGITAITVNTYTFQSVLPETGSYKFKAIVEDETTTWFLGETEVSLATYGIAVTGTVANNDEITVESVNDQTYKTERCKFTTAYGCLFVTSKAIKPIRLRKAQKDDDTSAPVVVVYPYAVVSCTYPDYWYYGRPGHGATHQHGYVKIKLNSVTVVSKDYYSDEDWLPMPNSYTIAQLFNEVDSEVRRGITAVPARNNPDDHSLEFDYIRFNCTSSDLKGTNIEIYLEGAIRRFHGHLS